MNAFKIYQSSAGSGKTFTLVKEYLRIVLERPEDYKHILAVTFTNKATEEMKSRIVDNLVLLSDRRNESLEKILQDELPGVNISRQAKRALELILHDYGNFSVCTIDSFFQKIMRALAREIHLPLRFEVEMRKDEVITAITEKLLNDVGKDAELTSWLSDLILQKLDDEKSWSIEGDIRFMADQLFKEKTIVDESLTREKIRHVFKQLLANKKSFEDMMKKSGDTGVSILEQHGFTATDFIQKDKGPAGYFYKIRIPNGCEKYKPNSYVLKALESPDNWVSKTSKKKSELTNLVESQLLQELEQVIQYFRKEFPRYAGTMEVLKKMYVLGIVNDLQKKLSEYREEKNTVMISDTPKILHSFISADDAPFIFEKTGNRYKHFLIDEFQDTSDLQWKNFLPLIINSLGSGNFCMVVGDAKQSIYRWRGGNMNLLAGELRGTLSQFESLIQTENLTTNYRSKQEIVDFNNSFFSHLPALINHELDVHEDTLLNLVYSEDLKQKVKTKNNTGGCVHVRFFDNDQADDSTENADPLNWKQKSLNDMLLVIHGLLKRNYSMRDISILVRNNKDGNAVADFLFENGITKILSPDSLLLSRSAVVQFLIHAFRFLSDNGNEVARSEILYYYAVHLSSLQPDDLHPFFADLHFSKTRRRKTSSATTLFDVDSLNDSRFNKTLPAEFTQHLLYLAKLPVYELSEQLVRIFGLDKNPDAYVQRFQDLVLEYAAKNNSSLEGFLEWWEESDSVRNCSVTIPENEDAIRIMTIHKSKGLQFPVVIMPFADWKLFPDNRDLMWVSSDEFPFNELGLVPLSPSKKLLDTSFKESYREEETNAVIDNINLLYVAFTRAEDQLYIFAPADKENNLNTTGKLISRLLHSEEELKSHLAEENTFSFGDFDISKESETKQRSPGIALKSYPSNRWQNRISITTHSGDLLDLIQSPGNSKINYGILVHKILSEINSTDEIDTIISRYYFEGLISESEKETLEEKIHTLLSNREVNTFFSPEWTVKSEREIILPGGELLRPDRVLIKEKKAIVIDFKTGKELQAHKRQVTRYADILAEMNYTDIEKYLVYVNDGKVKRVE